MENTCPNCHIDLSTVSTKSILNIFNIGRPEYLRRENYCSDQCIKTKMLKAPKEANEFFSTIISEKIIIGFYQSKNGEFAVIVDL